MDRLKHSHRTCLETKSTLEFSTRTIDVNDVSLKAIEGGQGKDFILFLHGFPDHAGSFKPLMRQFDPSRYTVAAPYMRGYGPSGPTPDGRYQIRNLADDALALVSHYDRENTWVIGHDWGAAAAYVTAVQGSDRLNGITAMSVPPMRSLTANLPSNPSQLLRSWYMLFFQLPWLPQKVLRMNDYALLEWFWSNWSPGWDYSEEELKELKRIFAQGETVENAIRYYRALLWDLILYPTEHRENRRLASAPVEIPTLVLTGQDDGCLAPSLFAGVEDTVRNRCSFEVVPDAGHFIPQEKPVEVSDRIKRFFEM